MTLETTTEEVPFHGELVSVESKIEYDLEPYDPGMTYGPPELCYPPEGGGVEITRITVQKIDWYDDYGNVTGRCATDDECKEMAGIIEKDYGEHLEDMIRYGHLCDDHDDYED